MTVSTVTSFEFGANEIIREAFDLIGVGAEGEAITADMYRRGKNSLNLMILSWNAIENLWRKEVETVALVSEQADYVITPKPMRVREARRVDPSGYETPMTEWSRQEYLDQPNKDTTFATPVNFYYDPQRGTGTLYLWPAPSAAVVAVGTSVKADILRPMFLIDTTADTLDMPQEWQETVIANLAQRLMMKYPVNDANLAARVDSLAGDSFARLKAWDNEPASIYLQPDAQGF